MVLLPRAYQEIPVSAEILRPFADQKVLGTIFYAMPQKIESIRIQESC